MTQVFTQSDFVERALAMFPELAADFASIAEYPTLHAGIFADRLQRAKGAADWDSYERGIRLIEELLPDADAELETSLRWRVMRALDFDGPRGPVAWEILGPELQHAWRSTRERLAKLTELPKKSKQPKGRRR